MKLSREKEGNWEDRGNRNKTQGEKSCLSFYIDLYKFSNQYFFKERTFLRHYQNSNVTFSGL